MVREQTDVTRQVQFGVDRLSKSCKPSSSPNLNLNKTDNEAILANSNVIKERANLKQQNSKEIASRLEQYIKNRGNDILSSCNILGSFFRDSIECELNAYKRNMLKDIQIKTKQFYDQVFERYTQYKILEDYAKSSCIKPVFLKNLLMADEEHIMPFEENSAKLFLKMIEEVDGASLQRK